VNGDAAVVVEDRDVGLLVAVEVDGDRLHARDVEVVRALEEPLGVRELAVGAAVEHDDPQTEVVVRIVDGGDLLRSVPPEVADEGEAVREGLRRGAASAGLQRRHQGERKDECQEKREEPHKRQNVRCDRFVTA